jgi:hypothetical protein
MHRSELPADVLAVLRQRCGDPGTSAGAGGATARLDERRQRAMTRYYLDAGAGGRGGGCAFDPIRHPRAWVSTQPVLESAMKVGAVNGQPLGGRRPLFMVAGLAGRTEQAVREAGMTARGIGYHAGHAQPGRAPKGASEDELLAHCQAVADGDADGGLLPAAGRGRHPVG